MYSSNIRRDNILDNDITLRQSLTQCEVCWISKSPLKVTSSSGLFNSFAIKFTSFSVAVFITAVDGLCPLTRQQNGLYVYDVLPEPHSTAVINTAAEKEVSFMRRELNKRELLEISRGDLEILWRVPRLDRRTKGIRAIKSIVLVSCSNQLICLSCNGNCQ